MPSFVQVVPKLNPTARVFHPISFHLNNFTSGVDRGWSLVLNLLLSKKSSTNLVSGFFTTSSKFPYIYNFSKFLENLKKKTRFSFLKPWNCVLKNCQQKVSDEKYEKLHEQQYTVKFYVKFKKMVTETKEMLDVVYNESAMSQTIRGTTTLKAIARVCNWWSDLAHPH